MIRRYLHAKILSLIRSSKNTTLLRSVKKTIDELEMQSRRERTKRFDIKPEDRMLAITYDTGQLMHSLLIGIKAKNALELGTSTGYSTLWMVDALLKNHDSPKIITLEGNASKIERARLNFERAKVSEFIDIRHGTILNLLKQIPRKTKFDFALIDADKENIRQYADIILPLLRVGGIMMTDNMHYPQKYRRTMIEYSRHLATKRKIMTCTVPVGNGQEITVKT